MEYNEIISPIIVTNLKNNLSPPLCDIKTIKKILNYLISKSRYRDNLLITLVVNLGISMKELLSLKFGDLYNKPLKDIILLKNINIFTDISIEEAIQLNRKNLKYYNSPENYVFPSISGNNYGNPMSVEAVNNIFRQIKDDLNLNYTLTYTSLIKTYLFYNQDNSTPLNLPIKNYDYIYRINDYLLQNQKYRDSVLFLIGINTGLKLSELQQLKFSDFVNSDEEVKDKYIINAKSFNSDNDISTAYIPINETIKTSIFLYQDFLKKILHNLDIYNCHLFISHSGNGYYKNKPISIQGIRTIIQNITYSTGLEKYNHIELFRKTFLYHQILMNYSDLNNLSFLQLMFKFKKTIEMFNYADFLPSDITI